MKKEHIILAIIFLIVFGIRLSFAFQTPNFSSDEAYYNIRQIDHIKNTFLPIIKDDLSYGGKILYLPPLFYYLMAGLSYIFKMGFAGKFFPNLFAASFVIVAYLISNQLTKNKSAKFLTVLMAGFMPLFFSETINSMSIHSFALPLTFFTLYCMIRIINKEKRFIGYFIPSLLVLRMTTPNVVFLIFALLVYLVFIFLEKMERTRAETELVLFSTFLIVWTLFVSFKKAFLEHGLAILWQNIPEQLLRNYFANINLLTVIYFIGLIPFIFGLYAIYKYSFGEKDKKIYLLISFAVVIASLMWLKLIELKLALMFIGFIMIFLFAKSYEFVLTIIHNKKLRLAFTLSIFLLILISSVVPSLVLASIKIKEAYSYEEISALEWLNRHTTKDDIILSNLDEGHMIATISDRKNFIDSNFMFVENIDQRLEDAYKMYKTPSQTQAITLMNKYGISYIYFSKRAKKNYGISEIAYADENCFEREFGNKDVEIYKSLCIIEEK